MNRGAWWDAVHWAAKEWATELATEQQQKLTYGKKDKNIGMKYLFIIEN